MHYSIKFLSKSIFLFSSSFLINNCLGLDNANNNADITTLTAITHQPFSQNEPVNQLGTIQLGGNFISGVKLALGNNACLNTSNAKYQFGNLMVTHDFTAVDGKATLAQVLGLSNTVNLEGASPTTKQALIRYAISQTNTTYNLNFNYVFDYSTKAVLSYVPQDIQDMLSDYGKDYYNKVNYTGNENDLKEFTAVCGDSFVSSADAGVKIIATYTLQFDNQVDKDRFAANLDKYTDIQNLTKQIMNTVESTKINVAVNLNTIQLGGIPRLLPDSGILGTNATYLISNNIASAALTCGKSENGNLNLAACENSIAQIINYAHATGEYASIGLEKQVEINMDSQPIMLTDFYYTNPTATPWKQIIELHSSSIAMK